MDISKWPEDDEPRRLVQQVQQIIDEHGSEAVAWSPPDQPEGFAFLYDPRAVLAREDSVTDIVGALNGSDRFTEDVVVPEPLPGDDSGLEPLRLRRVELPPLRELVNETDQPADVAMQVLDDQFNDPETRRVSPDHWLHLALGGGTKVCPATEPAETGLTSPWPHVSGRPWLGQGVRVSVVDSGLHALATQQPTRTPWLIGVAGIDEGNGPVLSTYAGHGTFIAGIVRCLAPAADVFVQRFLIGGAVLESQMVVKMRSALARGADIINLSAGSTTRDNRPLLSFEVFYEDDLSQAGDNCVLVAAGGNDGVADPFWPAAFEWAVGVGSLDRDRRVSSFSNHGPAPLVDIYALGRNLVNAYPDGVYVCREAPDRGDPRVFTTGLARWSGTSFSAPVVVGAIAEEMSTSGTPARLAWIAVRDRAPSVPDRDGNMVKALLPPHGWFSG